MSYSRVNIFKSQITWVFNNFLFFPISVCILTAYSLWNHLSCFSFPNKQLRHYVKFLKVFMLLNTHHSCQQYWIFNYFYWCFSFSFLFLVVSELQKRDKDKWMTYYIQPVSDLGYWIFDRSFQNLQVARVHAYTSLDCSNIMIFDWTLSAGSYMSMSHWLMSILTTLSRMHTLSWFSSALPGI